MGVGWRVDRWSSGDGGCHRIRVALAKRRRKWKMGGPCAWA
jgi:hypothetical protein